MIATKKNNNNESATFPICAAPLYVAVWLLVWLFRRVALRRRSPMDEPQFEVTGYEIEGDLPIPRERAQAILAPYTGRAVTLSQLKDAAKALETALSESGYPFYRVILPAQTAESVVKLRVLTFRLGNVSVQNNRYFSKENVLRSLPALRPGEGDQRFGARAQSRRGERASVEERRGQFRAERKARCGRRGSHGAGREAGALLCRPEQLREPRRPATTARRSGCSTRTCGTATTR